MTNSQRCIRPNDIENVGLSSRHHTFFEMLVIFFFGVYFKEEEFDFVFDFLNKK